MYVRLSTEYSSNCTTGGAPLGVQRGLEKQTSSQYPDESNGREMADATRPGHMATQSLGQQCSCSP